MRTVFVTYDLDSIMWVITRILDRSDYIYDEFDEPLMSHKMVWNLVGVLGFLSSRNYHLGGVYVNAMESRLKELISRSNDPLNFGWPDVRHIIGDSFEDGALRDFMEILHTKTMYPRETREMVARLVICCLFCEKHAGPVAKY
jgi:hypothetical protein